MKINRPADAPKTNPIKPNLPFVLRFSLFVLKVRPIPRRTLSGKNVFLRILVAKRCFLGYNPGCLEVLRTDKGEEKAIFMEQDGVFAHHIQD